MATELLKMTAQIVTSHVSMNEVTSHELINEIKSVYNTLAVLAGEKAASAESRSIYRSNQRNSRTQTRSSY